MLANRVEFASEWFMLLQRNFSSAELSTAKDILFSVAHLSRAVRSVCISSWVLFTAKFFKSSEEMKDSLNFRASGKLFMNKQSKSGPRIGLCGTPLLAFFGRIASTEAYNLKLVLQEIRQYLQNATPTPIPANYLMSSKYVMWSSALEKSM